MNTIGAAIDRGEIEVKSITWEEYNELVAPPCCYDCRFVSIDGDSNVVCTLFDRPYDGVMPAPTLPTSLASLMSVVVRCTLWERM